MKSLPISKSTLLTLAGVAIGTVFLLLAFRDTDLQAIGDAFRTANFLYVPLIVCALTAFLWIKTVRWSILLRPIVDVSSHRLLPVTVVGYASNILLPAQLGELVRTYLASKQLGVSASPILVTVLLERMFDFLTILVFVGAIVPFTPNTPDFLITAAKICGGIGITMFAGAMFGVFWPDTLTKLFRWSTRWLPRIIEDASNQQFEIAMLGLRSLASFRLLVTLIGSSLLLWSLMGLCTWLAILALNIDVPFSAAYVVLAVVVVGMTIPSSPGFFGTIQLCFMIGLGAFGVDATEAVAASILYHATMFFSVGLGGIYFARRMGYSTLELVRRSGSKTPK